MELPYRKGAMSRRRPSPQARRLGAAGAGRLADRAGEGRRVPGAPGVPRRGLAEKQLKRGGPLSARRITSPQDLDTLQSARDQTRPPARPHGPRRTRPRPGRGRAGGAGAHRGAGAVCGGGRGLQHRGRASGSRRRRRACRSRPCSISSTPGRSTCRRRSTRWTPARKIGQEVAVTVDSRRGRASPGRLVRVAPYVVDILEQNRTVEIEVDLDDARWRAHPPARDLRRRRGDPRPARGRAAHADLGDRRGRQGPGSRGRAPAWNARSPPGCATGSSPR